MLSKCTAVDGSKKNFTANNRKRKTSPPITQNKGLT